MLHGVVAERQQYQHTAKPAGYTMYQEDRTAAAGKTRGGGLCIFVNNSWCTISKEVSNHCSPEVVSHGKLQTTLPTERVLIYILCSCAYHHCQRLAPI